MLSQPDLTVKISEAVLLQAASDWSKAEEQGQSLGVDRPVDLQLNIDVADREDFDLSSQEQSKRFGPKSSPADLAKLVASRVPANTQRNTRWGVEVYNAWRNYRCKSGDPVPDLTTGSLAELDAWLPAFINEARRQNGKPYSPNTLYLIVCALQRHLRGHRSDAQDVNLLDLKTIDVRFAQTVKTLDARMKELTAQHVGIVVKQADVLSLDDERLLWERGAFWHDKRRTVGAQRVLLLWQILRTSVERTGITYVQPGYAGSRWARPAVHRVPKRKGENSARWP